MTFLLENFINTPRLKNMVSECGIVIDPDNMKATGKEIEFLVQRCVSEAIWNSEFRKEILFLSQLT